MRNIRGGTNTTELSKSRVNETGRHGEHASKLSPQQGSRGAGDQLSLAMPRDVREGGSANNILPGCIWGVFGGHYSV